MPTTKKRLQSALPNLHTDALWLTMQFSLDWWKAAKYESVHQSSRPTVWVREAPRGIYLGAACLGAGLISNIVIAVTRIPAPYFNYTNYPYLCNTKRAPCFQKDF